MKVIISDFTVVTWGRSFRGRSCCCWTLVTKSRNLQRREETKPMQISMELQTKERKLFAFGAVGLIVLLDYLSFAPWQSSEIVLKQDWNFQL